MAKGVRICLLGVAMFVTIVHLPRVIGNKDIVKYVFNNNGYGSYSFEFQTLDGTYKKEEGGLIKNMQGTNILTVRGEYGYIDSYGQVHTVRYVADANGFQPQIKKEDIRFNDRNIV